MAGSVKFSGNPAKIGQWAARFTQPRVDKVLTLANQNMAEEALGLVAEGFAAGRDPYGKAWNAPNDLQITGGIRRYAYELLGTRGYRLHATDQKAIWHHAPKPRPAWAGKKLPTRLQVPTKAKGVPKQWKVRLNEAAADAFRIFGKR